MANVYINNGSAFIRDIPKITNVTYNYLGEKVYSASKFETSYGIFVSTPIFADTNFIRWNNLTWVGNRSVDSEIKLYLRSADTESDLSIASWYGPYMNYTTDLDDLNGIYVQIMVILKCNTSSFSIPSVQSLSLSYISSQDSVKFFLRAFDVGFTPKHVLLTYNAAEDEDSIIRFAISGSDTTDEDKYQYISANTIEELTGIEYGSTKIKLMMELISSSNIVATVNEFAVTFSGDGQFKINSIYGGSSSSSSSSSSSTLSSSSSSSIDSSSSSSSSSSKDSSSSSSWEYSSESSSSSSSNQYSSSSSSSRDSSSSSSGPHGCGVGFWTIGDDFIVIDGDEGVGGWYVGCNFVVGVNLDTSSSSSSEIYSEESSSSSSEIYSSSTSSEEYSESESSSSYYIVPPSYYVASGFADLIYNGTYVLAGVYNGYSYYVFDTTPSDLYLAYNISNSTWELTIDVMGSPTFYSYIISEIRYINETDLWNGSPGIVTPYY